MTWGPLQKFSGGGNHCSSITAMKVGSSTSIGITKLVSDLVLWLELHKSSLHVHTVASPSCMHFSAPCIQQARNRTTPFTTCLMQPLLLMRSLHSSHCRL